MSLALIVPINEQQMSMLRYLDELLNSDPVSATRPVVDATETCAQGAEVSTGSRLYTVATHPGTKTCDFVDVDLMGGKDMSLWLDVEESIVKSLHAPPARTRGVTTGRRRQR